MSSSNNYADKKPTDLLKKVKDDVEENKADVSKLNDRTPQQLLFLPDGLKFGDAFSVVEATPGLDFSEGLRFTDSLSITDYVSGQFQITINDTADGPGVTQPSKIDMADTGVN